MLLKILKFVLMKIVKNPFKNNSYLLELDRPEFEYLKGYFRDMAVTEGEVRFDSSPYRSERFQRYYREMLKVSPQLYARDL